MYVNNGNYPNKDLSQIFPCYEILSAPVNNSNSDIDLTFTLTNNKTGTSNYYVFTSYYYLSAGSGSTYSPWAASSVTGPIMVYNKTTTTFRVVFNKGTGDIWDGGVNCFVIYPN